MHLHYSKHAKLRMIQRGITSEQIETCLSHFHEKYPDTKGNIQFAYRFEDGNLVRVVVKKITEDNWLVVTVKDQENI
jgi:hypothetical protein